MNKPSAVIVKDLHKTFKLPHEQHSGLKQLVVNFYKRKRGYEKQKVLTDISFEIKQGEFFGIVGRNGSGKSTLLKLLAGIYVPDKGGVALNGSLVPFIELGVGFNPELTGRENVFLNGALLGFNRKDMEAMYDDIVKFAELERFMDQKLKNYSSGMQVRLAFSIAIRADADILLIDEVLAVGDAIFQKKCYSYFKELKKRKKTVIFVSHDANVLQEYCDSGILIDKGQIVTRGKISNVVNDYIDLLNDVEENQAEKKTKKEKTQWGTGGIVVETVKLSGDQKEQKIFTEKDETIHVEVTYKATERIVEPIYGMTVTDASGQNVFASNTMWSELKTGTVKPGQRVKVRWDVPNAFTTGDFSIAPAVAGDEGAIMYDWQDDAAFFKVRKRLRSHAFVNLPHHINISGE